MCLKISRHDFNFFKTHLFASQNHMWWFHFKKLGPCASIQSTVYGFFKIAHGGFNFLLKADDSQLLNTVWTKRFRLKGSDFKPLGWDF